jgi:hypothetical protein
MMKQLAVCTDAETVGVVRIADDQLLGDAAFYSLSIVTSFDLLVHLLLVKEA